MKTALVEFDRETCLMKKLFHFFEMSVPGLAKRVIFENNSLTVNNWKKTLFMSAMLYMF